MCAVDDGKREKAGTSLLLFPFPIVPRSLSYKPLTSLSTTQGCPLTGGLSINLWSH